MPHERELDIQYCWLLIQGIGSDKIEEADCGKDGLVVVFA